MATFIGKGHRVSARCPLLSRYECWHIPRQIWLLELGFDQEQPCRHWADQHQGEVLAVGYGERVSLRLRLPAEQAEKLRTWCAAQDISMREP